MPSTYSSNLRIELIASGEQGNTWGNTTNNNLGTLIEQAISGYRSIDTIWSSNACTLTALNGANDQARNMFLDIPSSVSLTAEGQLVAPTVPKMYVIRNNSSGGYAVRIKTGSSSTTCLIPNGTTKVVVCDGTNFSEATTAAADFYIANTPTTSLQATNKNYVDTADNLRLKRDGTQNMTGELVLSSGSAPVNALGAVSKQYVANTYLPLSGGTLTGSLTLPSAAPTTTWQAVPKTYVDSKAITASAPLTATGDLGVGISLSVATATASARGVVKGGGNVAIAGDGTMTASGFVTGVSGSGAISSSGGTAPTITVATGTQTTLGVLKGGSNITIGADGSINAASSSGGTVTNVTGTLPISVANGATTPVVSIALASSSTSGYLSSTDWNVFNNKVGTTGSGATGTWGINISGNAATVTSGVYTTGSYSNPAWITSLAGSKISGAVASATTATSATTAASATNASQLGGISASGYLTTSTAASTYLPLSAGVAKPLTDDLYVGTSGTNRKAITGVFYSGGVYYPGIATYENSASAYAPFVIVQSNNSGISIKYNLTTAGDHNFAGNLSVLGNLSASGTKPFCIDHPVLENKKLYHVAVEAPRNDLIYRGKTALVNGQATVNIDDVSRLTTGTFVALTQNAEVVGLNNTSGFGLIRASSVVNGQFTIYAENTASTDEIAWIVMAERNDANMHGNTLCDENGRLVPEQNKTEG